MSEALRPEQPSVDVPASRPARPRRRRRWGGFGEWLVVLLTLAALVATAGALALVYGERDFRDRIYPNISVRGLNIGTMRTTEARRALERRYTSFLSYPIELVYGDQIWYPTAEQLGVSLDFERVLSAAHTIGRTQARADNLRTVAATWEQGVELPLHLRIDQQMLQRYLLVVAAELEQPPRDADLRLSGTNLLLIPDHEGMQVLVDETLADITSAIQGLEPQRIVLRTRTLAPRTVAADFDPIIAQVRTALAGPITLSGEGKRWQWKPEQIARWISLRPSVASDGRTSYTLAIDHAAIRSALVPIAAEFRQEGTLPRVAWNGGNLTIIQEGLPGVALDSATALNSVNAALAGETRTINLQLTSIAPPVTQSNLASLGIVEPVGTGVSSFRASQSYRITNIRAGARRMHGLLIPPGATFSFNENLGAVDARNGFVQGSAIVDNRTQKEWGGGLCQVSTTMFRAAFWAGLPITERHEHAFRIGWYEELGEPPGFDAAIFTPWSDIRFVNDTGGWLLIQTGVDTQRQRLSITLYGAPSARQVKMGYRILQQTAKPRKPVIVEDPSLPRGTFKKTDFARGGMKVELYRTVYEDGKVLANDVFPTEFKPWPDIYVRGTGVRR